MSWIKCSERMPNDDFDVLVAVKDGGGPTFVRVANYRTNSPHWWPQVHRDEFVTHWQPLPEAPKDGE